MDKRKLARIPPRKASEEEMQRFTLADDRCSFVCAEKQNEELLAVSVYDASMAKDGLDNPAMIVYFSKEESINRQFDSEAGCYEWRTGCLHKYFPYHGSKSLMDIQTKEVIAEFFGKSENWEKVIMSFQEGILAARLDEKHRLITDKIDEQMALIPPLPKRFEEYVGTKAMPQRYIIYEYGRRKQLQGFCTNCRQSVMAEEPRHNQAGKCPQCGSSATYKSRGRVKYFLYDTNKVCLPQKVKGGFVLRYFDAWRRELPNGEREVRYHEHLRLLYVHGESKAYVFDNFKATGIMRWCDCHYDYHLYDEWIYPTNLESLVAGSPWQFSSPSLYRQLEEKPCLSYYFKQYLLHPYIENLMKNGFYMLAKEIMTAHAWKKISIDKSKRRLHELLRVSKHGLKCLQEMKVDGEKLDVVQQLDAIGYSKYDTAFIAELQKEWGDKAPKYIANILPHTSHLKAMRYAGTLKNRETSDWLDYAKMAVEIGYDMRKEHAIFPRKLKKAHETVTWAHREMMAKTSESDFAPHVPRLKACEWQPENSQFQLVAPQTALEIVNEGHSLNHCVHDYIKRVIEGTCEIMFLRQKDKPKKSYVTVEIRDKKVQQYRGVNNDAPPKSVCDFVKDYGAWLSKTAAIPIAA